MHHHTRGQYAGEGLVPIENVRHQARGLIFVEIRLTIPALIVGYKRPFQGKGFDLV